MEQPVNLGHDTTLLQFSTPARESIVFVKGMVGICQLVFALIYAVILLRYRSLVPAMCLLILTEWGLNRILRELVTFHEISLIHGHIFLVIMWRERS